MITPHFLETGLHFDNPSGDGRNVVLTAPLDFVSADGNTYRVPIGAITDGASVPKAFQNIISVNGPHFRAAALHDSCYHCTTQILDHLNRFIPVFIDKPKADALILEAMLACGVGRLEAETIYLAVKEFGTAAWSDGMAMPLLPRTT